jgi:putative peptide zinc metalloprotease protein
MLYWAFLPSSFCVSLRIERSTTSLKESLVRPSFESSPIDPFVSEPRLACRDFDPGCRQREIFIWALATVTWRLTEHGTWVQFFGFSSHGDIGDKKSLFNLNPLIKLDGYYLLSDYLEVPNLRKKSFSYIGTGIKRLWGSAVEGRKEISRREQWIYLTYGLLAGAFSFWLLGFVALTFGGFLVGRYQGMGFILFMLFLLALFRNRLSKILTRLPTVFRTSHLKRASMPRPTKLLILFTMAMAVLFLGRMELKVSGEFKVLPVRTTHKDSFGYHPNR